MRFDFFRSLALTAIYTLEMGHAVKLDNVEAVFHNAPAWAELDNQPVIPFKLSQIDNESIAEKDDPKSADSTPEEKVVSSESDFSDGKDAEKAKDEVNEKIKESEDKAITDKVKKIDAVTEKDGKGTTQQKPVDPLKKFQKDQAVKDAEKPKDDFKSQYEAQDKALINLDKKIIGLEKQLKDRQTQDRKWETQELIEKIEASSDQIPNHKPGPPKKGPPPKDPYAEEFKRRVSIKEPVIGEKKKEPTSTEAIGTEVGKAVANAVAKPADADKKSGETKSRDDDSV